MTQIQQQVLQEKQLQCDLIEIGVTRAAGALIKENMEAVDDEALTIQKVRLLANKLNMILDAFDTIHKDVESYKQYAMASEAEADQQTETEINHDDHK